MNRVHDPLEDSGDGLPANPGRRRLAVGFGILMLIVIVGVLGWFVVTNTETDSEPPRIIGWNAGHGAATAPPQSRSSG